MKKFILATVIMLSSAAVYAQHETGAVTLQPKVGLNVANVTKWGGGEPRFGLAVGAELEYQATDMVSFSGAAMYSMQGVKGSDSGIDGTIKLDYINIPLLANVYLGRGFAVKLGIQPGFMINDKVKVSTGGVTAEVSLEKALEAAEVDVSINKFDLTIPVGLSYEFRNNLVLDARCNFGVTKIIKEESGCNNVFQFTVGYKFDL